MLWRDNRLFYFRSKQSKLFELILCHFKRNQIFFPYSKDKSPKKRKLSENVDSEDNGNNKSRKKLRPSPLLPDYLKSKLDKKPKKEKKIKKKEKKIKKVKFDQSVEIQEVNGDEKPSDITNHSEVKKTNKKKKKIKKEKLKNEKDRQISKKKKKEFKSNSTSRISLHINSGEDDSFNEQDLEDSTN